MKLAEITKYRRIPVKLALELVHPKFKRQMENFINEFAKKNDKSYYFEHEKEEDIIRLFFKNGEWLEEFPTKQYGKTKGKVIVPKYAKKIGLRQ